MEYKIDNEKEAIEMLNKLYAEAKANPHGNSWSDEPRHSINIHTSGWIVTPIISIGIQAARQYIKKAFAEGNETFNRYINKDEPFLVSGHVVCEVKLGDYNIHLNMTSDNVVRTDASQAQQDELTVAKEQIYGA